MTVPYTHEASQSSFLTVWRILVRWRGSLWKSVLPELCVWTLFYLLIQVIYRFALNDALRVYFDYVSKYLNTGMDSYIPMAFILGFFVSTINNRWQFFLNNLGWIDEAAMTISGYINGDDECTTLLRRTLIRYMVLNQAMVFRDMSLQVRNRFPTMESFLTAGLVTNSECERLSEINDECARHWIPIQWAHQHVTRARACNRITTDAVMIRVINELDMFQRKLHYLLKLDWVPVPLVYPQLVLLFVRVYFFICLFSKQFLQSEPINIWLPIVTMTQFVVYMGWLRVAEDMLNPFGDDDDDFECNSLIDRNLITGLAIVDSGTQKPPSLEKDLFYADGPHLLAPKSEEDLLRSPLVGSVAKAMIVEKANKRKRNSTSFDKKLSNTFSCTKGSPEKKPAKKSKDRTKSSNDTR